MGKEIKLIRAPQEIQNKATKEILTLQTVDLGLHPRAIYKDSEGSSLWIDSNRVEREFSYPKVAPSNLVPQGKFECAPASLAILLGHTLFNVKRVMGDLGWCNDRRGAGDNILRKTARVFGHDLLYCGNRSIFMLLNQMPPSLITLPSLNYPGAFHGVAWYEGQIIDPNHGRAGRLVYGSDWAPWTIGAESALVLTNKILSDKTHREFKELRLKGRPDEIRAAVLGFSG